MSLDNAQEIKLEFLIPAYDLNQQGLTVRFSLCAKPSVQFKLSTTGPLADALAKSFTRVVQIMISLKAAWNCLAIYQYTLASYNNHFNVKDARSADLSLCIAAINIIRSHHQKPLLSNYMGTGSLRIDGSFNETFLESVKAQAAYRTIPEKKFLQASYCQHIFDLEALLENENKRRKHEV